MAGSRYNLPAYQEGSNGGGSGEYSGVLGRSGYNMGAGGDGWYPGFIGRAGSPWWLYVPWSFPAVSSSSSGSISTSSVSGISSGRNAATYAYKNPIFTGYYGLSQYTATTTPYGGIGYSGYTYESSYMIQIAGFGYGAGGAGANIAYHDKDTGSSSEGYQSGGNSGVIKITSYTLSNTDTIAVTVGNGGNGGYYSSTGMAGGGARGCVAVYW